MGCCWGVADSGVAFGVVSRKTDYLPEVNTAVQDDNVHDGLPARGLWVGDGKSGICLCVAGRPGAIRVGSNASRPASRCAGGWHQAGSARAHEPFVHGHVGPHCPACANANAGSVRHRPHESLAGLLQITGACSKTFEWPDAGFMGCTGFQAAWLWPCAAELKARCRIPCETRPPARRSPWP